jgi:hypothetical protein
LQSLPHGFGFSRLLYEARGHRLDALALAVEKKPRDLVPEGGASLRSPLAFEHLIQECGQLLAQLLQVLRRHCKRRSRA